MSVLVLPLPPSEKCRPDLCACAARFQVLTSGISEDVVGAMRQLVSYILRAPSGDEPLAKDAEVTLEQAKLQQLCLYQLVLGYRLREAEATGEANDAVGR